MCGVPVQKSDAYKENLGPGSYPNYDARILGAHSPPGDWMPRAHRFTPHNSHKVTPDMLRTSTFNFAADFRQNWVRNPGCGNIVLGKDPRFKDSASNSMCDSFYDTGSSLDYLRYPGRTVRDESGRVTPEVGTNVAKYAFRSKVRTLELNQLSLPPGKPSNSLTQAPAQLTVMVVCMLYLQKGRNGDENQRGQERPSWCGNQARECEEAHPGRFY